MLTQISSCESAIIGDAEQVLSLCGADAGRQPVEKTTATARVSAPASPVVAELPRNSKQCQAARCTLQVVYHYPCTRGSRAHRAPGIPYAFRLERAERAGQTSRNTCGGIAGL